MLFFDIDSTLTQGGPGTIHPGIKAMFDEITDRGIRIFFATERSMYDLCTLVQKYSVESYAIAENGGDNSGFWQ